MKKGVLTILGVLLCFGLAACAGQQAAPSVSEQGCHRNSTAFKALLTARQRKQPAHKPRNPLLSIPKLPLQRSEN